MKQTVLSMTLEKNHFIIKALNSQKLQPMKGTAVVPYIHEVPETICKNKNETG
jgi:hypothetical protein